MAQSSHSTKGLSLNTSNTIKDILTNDHGITLEFENYQQSFYLNYEKTPPDYTCGEHDCICFNDDV
jgi:hypothetical protein